MITLFTFGRYFGLPDPSPFVCKAEILLKMAGVAYTANPFATDMKAFNNAPKGKLPYMDDAGTIVTDSTFIRWHLEQKHGADFDKGLSPEQKGGAWAVEKMCENHLYWAIVDSRWVDDANFNRGPVGFFGKAPALIRPLVVAMARRQVRGNLKGQGFGRHSRSEIEQLAAADLAALSNVIGTKPWLMGPEPCGADASVWSFVAGALCPVFESPIRTAAEGHANLVAYRDRGFARWCPEIKPAAA